MCLCCQSILLPAPFLPNCFLASWHHTAQLHCVAQSWGQNFAFAFVRFHLICVTMFQGDLDSLENNSPALWTAPWFGVILKSRRVHSIWHCNKRYWRISVPLWGFKQSTSKKLPVELFTGGAILWTLQSSQFFPFLQFSYPFHAPLDLLQTTMESFVKSFAEVMVNNIYCSPLVL